MKSAVLALVMLLGGCGLGVGRTSSALAPAVNVVETRGVYEVHKDDAHITHGWVRYRLLGFAHQGWGNYTGGYFGVHLATMFGRVRSTSAGLPTSSGWMFDQHVSGVVGVGALSLRVDYAQRTEHFDYDRGFGGEMKTKGLVYWLGYAPVAAEGALGLAVGYGPIRDATLSLGSSDDRALYGSASASGSYVGVALDTFVVGGGFLQWGVRPRLVVGYSSVEPDVVTPNLPTDYGGLSVGVETIFTIL